MDRDQAAASWIDFLSLEWLRSSNQAGRLSRQLTPLWSLTKRLEVAIAGAGGSSAPQESSDEKGLWRFLQAQGIWILVALGVPFIILGLVSGFGEVFRSGEASTFASGALTAAIGEILTELIKDGFRELKGLRLRTRGKVRTDEDWAKLMIAILTNLIALGLLGWNLYFAVQDKAVHYPAVDWVQVLAFVIGAGYAVNVRFSVDLIDEVLASGT